MKALKSTYYVRGVEDKIVYIVDTNGPLSVTNESVFVETLPVTDHPSASVVAQGEVVASLEVTGPQLKIKL